MLDVRLGLGLVLFPGRNEKIIVPCLAFPSKGPNGARGPEPNGQTREVEALGWTGENWGPGTTD